MNILENYNIKQFNTFGVDCITKYFYIVKNIQDLNEILIFINEKKLDYLILGSGSNILFTKNFNGIIIKIEIKGIEIIEETKNNIIIKSYAGEIWDEFVSFCIKNNWQGLENLSLIPGTVGASPIQNIGAYGIEVKNNIIFIEYLDINENKIYKINNNECCFSYRNSIFKNKLKNKIIILSVYFKLNKINFNYYLEYKDLKEHFKNEKNITLKKIRDFIIFIRQNKLPDYNKIGNAGSFFKNPIIDLNHFNNLKLKFPDISYYIEDNNNIKISAAWLIENIGFKNKQIGNVATYSKQPLVLINLRNANGKEILLYSNIIQEIVKQKFNIQLDIEVNIN